MNKMLINTLSRKNDTNETLQNLLGVEMGYDVNLQLPDPLLVTWYRNYNARTLWLDKDINDSLFDEARMILQWNREDNEKNIPIEQRKPIKLCIHSYGGELDDTFAFIDIMNLSKTPVWTINMNACMSAGGIILVNGHKGKRYAMPMSSALIHSGSGSNSGTFETVVAQTKNYKKMVNMMRDNMIEHTNITKQMFTKNSKHEWYIYGEDQVKYGLVDQIITDISEIL